MTITTTKDMKILFLGSVQFKGTIEVESGLHIGDSDNSIRIGGVDRSVIKDPASKKPYIPGSSIKGKQRSLTERNIGKPANRGAAPIFRYEVDDINQAITDEVCRIFGSTAQEKSKINFPSRILVRDSFLSANSTGLLEKKSENTIDRIGGAANPRTNERVAKAEKFDLNIDYNIEVILEPNNKIFLGVNSNGTTYWKILIEDLHLILDSFALIEKTYLGGNGSRGYGKVKILPEMHFISKDEIIGKRYSPPRVSTINDHIIENYIDPKNPDDPSRIIRFANQRKEVEVIVRDIEDYYHFCIQALKLTPDPKIKTDEK